MWITCSVSKQGERENYYAPNEYLTSGGMLHFIKEDHNTVRILIRKHKRVLFESSGDAACASSAVTHSFTCFSKTYEDQETATQFFNSETSQYSG